MAESHPRLCTCPDAGWVEWDRDGRVDDIRSFDLRASDNVRVRVHVGPSGRSDLIISPLGILAGSFARVEQAFRAGEQLAAVRARNTIEQAQREIEDAEAALAFLEALPR